jgi:trans-L-3-hydroxyproline dehydratase
MQNGGYSPMCGHAVIALAKVAVAMGWVAGDPDPDGRVSFNIETPAGLVRAHVCAVDGRILSASYESVPSFVQALDLAAQVSGLGAVPFDLAFGGAFYAYVDADALGLSLLPDNSRTLIDAGRTIQHTVAEQFAINHPVSVDLSFLFGTLFYGRSQGDAHSRQVTIFEDGFLDRSPTGTGVAGRMAVLHKRNAVRPQETLTFESITGGRFTGRVLSENDFAGLPAVTPEIGGNASITGRHEFILEPDDPMSVGFFIR